MDMKETNSSVATAEAENDKTLNPVIDNKIDTEDISDSQDKLSDITSPEVSPKSNKIPLVIRCPFTTTDLNIYIDPTHNVLHLKKKIYKEFPSNPKPSDQRLIFGGRIINNNEILQDILKRQLIDLSTPPIIHLIINSLAIKHAQTVKPSSSNNSENVSTSNSVQNSPTGSKQNLNETTSTSTNNISNSTTTSNNTTNQSSSSTMKETPAPTNSEESKPSSSVNNVSVTSKPISNSNISSDGVQYILLNNVIYAVQPSPEYLSNGDSRYKIQAPVDFKSTIESETINENNNTNNNNNANNAQPAVDNANANNNNNGQEEILNQILNDNDQQRQQPNQFFLFIRLAFIVYLLTQGGGYIRMFIVSFIAIIIFLVQTGRIRVTVINYRDLPGVNAENNNNNANQNEQANNNNDNNNNNNNNNDNNNNNNNNNDNNNNNNNNNDNNRDVNVNNEAAGNNENDPLLNNADGNNNNNNNPENVVPQYSFLTNCRRVFFAFFLSLIPFIQDIA